MVKKNENNNKPLVLGYVESLNPNDRIALSVSEYNGKESLDIRTMYNANKEGGEDFRFTPKGVKIPKAEYGNFIKLIKKFKRFVQE